MSNKISPTDTILTPHLAYPLIVWATIIHESLKGEVSEDLDYHTSNPLSPWAAIVLLYRQFLRRKISRQPRTPRKTEEYVLPLLLRPEGGVGH